MRSRPSFATSLISILVLCTAYGLWTVVPYNRGYFVYLLGSYLIAYFILRLRGDDPKQMFSKSVWFHNTSRNEAYVIIIVFLTWMLIIRHGTVFSEQLYSNYVQAAFASFELPVLTATPPASIGVLYILASLLAYEASYYAAHRLLHGNRFFWEFHKVHHSAQVMTPFTSLRQHPVEFMLNTTFRAVFVGAVTAVFLYFYPGIPGFIYVVESHMVLAAFFFLGGSLAHSHVWISWGPLNSWFISPAMHQVHHSSDPRHFDKNFGLMLTCFDRCFGTAYIPEGKEELNFGLGQEEDNKFLDLKGTMLAPFVRAIRQLRGSGSPIDVVENPPVPSARRSN